MKMDLCAMYILQHQSFLPSRWKIFDPREISDRRPVRAVYSPIPVALDRQDENHVTAGYEAQDVLPDSDFDLFYSLGETEAFHLFSYRDPSDLSDPEGFFMLLLAPKPGGEQQPVAKDVLLVLDRSGSMDGEKFRQAQSALRYILSRLNPKIVFTTDLQYRN